MSAASERALRKAMREKTFERVYYFVGDDDFLKESTAREFITAAVDPATRDFNLVVVRGLEATPEALDTALNTPPLLSERRLVVVRDAQSLRKEARKVLLTFLEHPAADCILLLLAAAGEKADPAFADRGSTVDFEPLRPDRVPRWIAHYAKETLGAEISPEAATLLHDAVGGDLASLATELDKLASYTAGGVIDESAVTAVVGARHGESLNNLIDAVSLRDGARADELVAPVLASTRTTAVAVIMTLATQILAIAWGRAARERGIGPGAIEREYYALLKASRIYTGRSWSDAVSSWTRSIGRWTTDDLNQGIRLLLAADAAAKESRVSSEEQLIRSLVLSLCATGARAAA